MPRTHFLDLITGSFSSPAADKPTVAIVEASFAATGVAGRYVNCEVGPTALGPAVRGAVAQGWRGFNCSLPHKVAILDHLDELTPAAGMIGAVNCVTIDNGRMIGENTDGKGFLAALQAVHDPRGASVVVLGAGGASRAIAVELALAGAARLTIVNRDRGRAEAVADIVRRASSTSVDVQTWAGTYPIPGTQRSSSMPHPSECARTSTRGLTSPSTQSEPTSSSPTSCPIHL